ncbi:MAG: DUF3822 family protein [Flavisolibacter sp.]
MKTVFTIGNAHEGCDTLLLEIGEDYCCYALLRGAERRFERIQYFTFDAFEAEARLLEILSGVETQNCHQLMICSAFPQSLLAPRHGHRNDYILLNVLYELPSQKFLKDDIPEWQMTVTYSVPLSFFNSVRERFRFPEFVHAYTPSLKVFNGFSSANQIDLHFSIQHFRVIVKKDNHIQLAQTYSYKNPLDVVYYLLKICYEVGLEQSEVTVVLSGLIDQDSAMFSELHSYFLNLHFAQAPSYSIPENEYPQHYFTSLYNLAACVS